MHIIKRSNNLNQSIASQNSPPFIREGLVFFSSAYIPKFQNNLSEIKSNVELKAKIKIDILFFKEIASLITSIWFMLSIIIYEAYA